MSKTESDKKRKECYCINALRDWLKGHHEECKCIKDGGEPPDFTACINGKYFAIEVTEFMSLGNVEGKKQSRDETNVWVDKVGQKLQHRIRELNATPGKYCIALTPMKNGKKQNRVIDKLAHLIADVSLAEEAVGWGVLYRTNDDQLFCKQFPINDPSGDFSYDYEWWQVIRVLNYDTPVVKIWGWSYDSDSIGEMVAAQLEPDDIRLEKLISNKNDKLNKIKDETVRGYPRILLIHSVFDDPYRLRRVWESKKSTTHKATHFFNRIFLVNRNNQGDRVTELIM